MQYAFSQLFYYLFWPNPANTSYGSAKVEALLVLCAVFIIASAVFSLWRKRMASTMVRKLSRSWASAAFWFGFVGVILIVARVEEVQYVAMRLWWIFWLAAAIFYIFVQYKLFRARHYEILPHASVDDPRSKYLPRKKK